MMRVTYAHPAPPGCHAWRLSPTVAALTPRTRPGMRTRATTRLLATSTSAGRLSPVVTTTRRAWAVGASISAAAITVPAARRSVDGATGSLTLLGAGGCGLRARGQAAARARAKSTSSTSAAHAANNAAASPHPPVTSFRNEARRYMRARPTAAATTTDAEQGEARRDRPQRAAQRHRDGDPRDPRRAPRDRTSRRPARPRRAAAPGRAHASSVGRPPTSARGRRRASPPRPAPAAHSRNAAVSATSAAATAGEPSAATSLAASTATPACTSEAQPSTIPSPSGCRRGRAAAAHYRPQRARERAQRRARALALEPRARPVTIVGLAQPAHRPTIAATSEIAAPSASAPFFA